MDRQQVGIGSSREDLRERPRSFQRIVQKYPVCFGKGIVASSQAATTDGIIDRRLFPDVPPHVEYTISDLGKSLLPNIEVLIAWGQTYFDRIMENRRKAEANKEK